jgi:hypothetical protein
VAARTEVAVAAAAVALAAGSATAQARPLPDLTPRSVSAPAAVTVGTRFIAHDVLTNRGGRTARRSTMGYYLSRDRRRGAGDLRLGLAAVRPIRPGRRSSRRKVLTLPADANGRYRLIACADVLRRVRERRERNNCVATRGVIAAAAFESPGPVPNDEPGPPQPEPPAPQPEPDPVPQPGPGPEPEQPTLLAAGDIASCDSSGDEATAALLDDPLDAVVAPLGDLVYGGASLADFNDCYDPSWGAARARTRPATGNHEYDTAGADGYFSYFGAAAGDRGEGWYSYELGDWHVIALNSNCAAAGGCFEGSEQERWLEADLATHPATCTLAYWHHPLFTSDAQTGRATDTLPLWNALYAAGGELVLNGHAHEYERFAPQRPNATADASAGIREFVVGTGGRSFGTFAARPTANSEARQNSAFGVLSLRLDDGSYSWRFVPVSGGAFSDSGSEPCH